MLFLLFAPLSACAASGPPPAERIVVTATRTASPEGAQPFTTGSVSGERWDASGGSPENALSSLPGVALTGSGGPGQPRSLFLRGAKSEHTLVLVDGIPVNDPLSPSRSFDFGQLPVDEIERVEILHGPQSVLYGSDAMGGVVQLFTRRDPKSRARVEGGSYGSRKARLSTMGFHAGYAEAAGFSAADEREGNRERDGHREWSLGGAREFAAGDSALMRLQAHFKDSRTDTDRGGGSRGDSWNSFARHQQFLLRSENTLLLGEENGELGLSGSYSAHNRDDNTNGNDFFKAELWRAEGSWRRPLGSGHSAVFGADFGEESGSSSQTSGGRRRLPSGALFLQDHWVPGRLHAVAGARRDFPSGRESSGTWRAGLGYWIIDGGRLRIKGSYGTGFKAPSLYQTYSIYGSSLLAPERSRGGELGLEANGERWTSALTAFRTDFDELIDFNTASNGYFNRKRAFTEGFEWGAELRAGLVRLANAYTFLRAFDGDTLTSLPRRPRHSDTLELGLQDGKRWAAGTRLRYVGEREDSHPLLFTRQAMPAFLTLGADARYLLAEGLQLTGRAENLLDRHYQESAGYGVPALSLYLGLGAEL